MVITRLDEVSERDIVSLAELLYQEWSEFDRWSSKETIITRLKGRCANKDEEITLIATESTALLATASIINWELSDEPERQYWLGEVLTAPEHRGKGVAGQLIQALVDVARKAGYPALWLYTPDKQSLYQHHGWHRVEEKYVENEWVTVMVYRLSGLHCTN